MRRGVADGLARLLGVPRHPDSVQAILDEDVRAEEDHASPTLQVAAGCARQA
ncbi:hypothetical protein ACU4GA_09820 [Methylobacterium oryzae CBMB20]